MCLRGLVDIFGAIYKEIKMGRQKIPKKLKKDMKVLEWS